MSDAEMLRAMADRQAITDLIHRYCRAVDRIDAELGYSIWHEGAVADYGDAIYRGTGRGVIDHICAQHRQALAHHHQVSNITIDLDGDRAGSEAYVRTFTQFMVGAARQQVTVCGRYIDKWSRRNGRWGIEKRIFLRDLDETREITPLSDALNGRRDHEDASYMVLKPIA